MSRKESLDFETEDCGCKRRRRHKKKICAKLIKVNVSWGSSKAENLSAQGIECCKAIGVSVCAGMFKILNLAFFQAG